MYEPQNDFDLTLDTFNSIKNKLDSLGKTLPKKKCFLGFDGYIDSLYSICSKRESPKEWTRMESMETFGNILVDVAGSSANIERVLKRKISGGFAPNSCKAINALNIKVFLIAALGYPSINHLFEPISERTSVEAISFSNPGETAGLEFDDGKVMLTDFENILNIDWDLLIDRVGLDMIIEKIEASDILGFGHWSLVPNLGKIWSNLMDSVFPNIDNLRKKLIFVDLADIKKRNKSDILQMLDQLHQLDDKIPVMLSLNDQEAIDISKSMEQLNVIDPAKNNYEDYVEAGKEINKEIDISYLVIHSPHFATISTPKNHYWVTEGYTSKPSYTTGAGDHFHSGVAAGLSCGLTPPEAILLGNALTAIFVRTGDSPDFATLSRFIHQYMDYIENDNPKFP